MERMEKKLDGLVTRETRDRMEKKEEKKLDGLVTRETQDRLERMKKWKMEKNAFEKNCEYSMKI